MNYKKTTLPNGLRIITVPMKDAQTAIGMVLVETGSHYEDKKTNGLSHFLEHMCFKGTEKRNGVQIKYDLDSIGSASNAFTGFEYTGYYAKAHFKKINKVIDIVSDIFLNPKFPEKDIESERGVITEEINLYEDLPSDRVVYVWFDLLYGNQPAGRSILGSEENIRKFKQKDFLDYHKKHYIAPKTVVVVAGNIDSKKVIKQIKEQFKNAPKGKIVKKRKVKSSQKSPKIKIKNKKTDQTHLIVGFRSFDIYDDRNYSLKVAATILGQGFSSRLFSKMRDELGMCYYTKAGVDASTDHGDFTVSAGVTNKRTQEAVEVIMEEFRKLRDEDISEKELKKAKEFIIGNKANYLETSNSLAMYYGFQELHHLDIQNPREFNRKIKAVTEKDIKRVLKQVMKNNKLNLALIGPHKDAKKFKKLLKV